MYVGASNREPNGSFITTEWLAILLPIIPLKSSRVNYLDEKSGIFEHVSAYEILNRVPLDLRGVAKVYGFYLFCLLCTLVFGVMSSLVGGAPLTHIFAIGSVISFFSIFSVGWVVFKPR